MDYQEFSDILLNFISKRADPVQLLNTAEDFLGNPMAVGRTDMKIVYVSKGMPKDSIIAKPGMMQGYNNVAILKHMKKIEQSEGPVFLDDQSSNGKDKYQTILSPIVIVNHPVGYLSIRSVKRNHDEEDIRAARIITEALVLLFKITADQNFIPSPDRELLLEALIEKKDVDYFAASRLQDELKKNNGLMRVTTFGFLHDNKANTIPNKIRIELCEILESDIYVSLPGSLVIISMVDANNKIDVIHRILISNNLLMGVSYDCKPDVYNIFPAYYQSVVALKLTSKECPYVFLLKSLPEYFKLKEIKTNDFNNMVHPAAFMLKEYDNEHGTALCQTIIVYLENKQSIKATADSLGVHVNTINQRFQQISNLLIGFKFCSDSLFDFYLSLSNNNK